MNYVLLAATALGGVALYLMLPREKASLAKLGMLLSVLAFGGLFLFLFRMLATSPQGVSTVDPYFYLFAAIMVAGSIGVVCQPKPVYAALYFVLVTLAGAGLFVMLLAEFMAIVLIIIYAGAILVTYVFVIMLASQSSSGTGGEATSPIYDREAAEPFAAVLISFILLGAILQCIYPTDRDPKQELSQLRQKQEQLQVETLAAKDATALKALAPAQAEIKTGVRKLAERRSMVQTFFTQQIDDASKTIDDAQVALEKGDADAGDKVKKATKELIKIELGNADPRMVQRINEAIIADGTLQQIPVDPDAKPIKPMGDTQLLGNSLYGQYAISLELAGILLTIALIGAVVIARKEAPSAVLGTGQVPNE